MENCVEISTYDVQDTLDMLWKDSDGEDLFENCDFDENSVANEDSNVATGVESGVCLSKEDDKFDLEVSCNKSESDDVEEGGNYPKTKEQAASTCVVDGKRVMWNTLFLKTLLWLRSEMLDESHFKPAGWLVTHQATL